MRVCIAVPVLRCCMTIFIRAPDSHTSARSVKHLGLPCMHPLLPLWSTMESTFPFVYKNWSGTAGHACSMCTTMFPFQQIYGVPAQNAVHDTSDSESLYKQSSEVHRYTHTRLSCRYRTLNVCCSDVDANFKSWDHGRCVRHCDYSRPRKDSNL